jgi:hypothetical protein
VLLTETGAGLQHSRMAALAHLGVLRGCGSGFQNGAQNGLEETQAGVTKKRRVSATFQIRMQTEFSGGLAFVGLKAGDFGNEEQRQEPCLKGSPHCRKGRLLHPAKHCQQLFYWV